MRSLFPQPGIKPTSPVLQKLILNHWTQEDQGNDRSFEAYTWSAEGDQAEGAIPEEERAVLEKASWRESKLKEQDRTVVHAKVKKRRAGFLQAPSNSWIRQQQ